MSPRRSDPRRSATPPPGQLRVIAGANRGTRLIAPPEVRPTTGRVREAIFSSLGSRIVDAVVLDLYAGSGALAIEALSRGARSALLVESDRAALDACRANLDRTKLAARARVTGTEVGRFVAGAVPPEAPFALVLCDPPYEMDDANVTAVLEALAGPGWLEDDARVIVERPRRRHSGPGEAATIWPEGFVDVWERAYGDTLVTALEPNQ